MLLYTIINISMVLLIIIRKMLYLNKYVQKYFSDPQLDTAL